MVCEPRTLNWCVMQANSFNVVEVKEKLLKARDQGVIKESTFENASLWLKACFSEVEIDKVQVGTFIEQLANEEQLGKLDDCFYKMNSFGTAGVRGKLEIGTAYFNTIILGLGVEAHARYIHEAFKKNGTELGREKAVVLAYDSRRGSFDPETGGPGFLVMDAQLNDKNDNYIIKTLDIQ